MKYECESCSYSTDDLSNFGRHNMSTKHKNKCNMETMLVNVETIQSTDQSTKITSKILESKDVKYECACCPFTTQHKSSYYRHKSRCTRNTNNKDTSMGTKLLEFMMHM